MCVCARVGIHMCMYRNVCMCRWKTRACMRKHMCCCNSMMSRHTYSTCRAHAVEPMHTSPQTPPHTQPTIPSPPHTQTQNPQNPPPPYLPNVQNTIDPATNNSTHGANNASPHESVRSNSTPVSATPKIPGIAPAVLVHPSSSGAYLGDRSAWLQ